MWQHQVVRAGPLAYHIEFDTSPWGEGAILFRFGVPFQVLQLNWDSAVCALLKVEAGLPKYQALWECVTLFLRLVSWGSWATEVPIMILGDNVGALQHAIALKGKGHMLIVAREKAWRQARVSWKFDVSHFPNECNHDADALSRISAPEPAPFRSALARLYRVVLQPWSSLFRAL